MSFTAIKWARSQQGLPTATRLLLRELADRHTDMRGCFPGLQSLASNCDVSLATVKRHLRVLEGLGLLIREQRRDRTGRIRTTFYHLRLDVVVERNRGEIRVLGSQRGHGSFSTETMAHIAEPESKLNDRNKPSAEVETPGADAQKAPNLVANETAASGHGIRRGAANAIAKPLEGNLLPGQATTSRHASNGNSRWSTQVRNATLYEDARDHRLNGSARAKELAKRVNDRFLPDMTDDATRCRLGLGRPKGGDNAHSGFDHAEEQSHDQDT